MKIQPWVDPVLQTNSGFNDELVQQGHVRFVLDGTKYFIFPEGPHKYGLCYWSDMSSGGFPRWEFESEEELMNAKLFNGHSIAQRLGEILTYDESTDYQ